MSACIAYSSYDNGLRTLNGQKSTDFVNFTDKLHRFGHEMMR